MKKLLLLNFILAFFALQNPINTFPGDRKEGYTCPGWRSTRCTYKTNGEIVKPMPGNPPGINESCGKEVHDPDHHFSMFGDSDQHHSPFFVIKERRAKKMPARRLTSCKPARGMSE